MCEETWEKRRVRRGSGPLHHQVKVSNISSSWVCNTFIDASNRGYGAYHTVRCVCRAYAKPSQNLRRDHKVVNIGRLTRQSLPQKRGQNAPKWIHIASDFLEERSRRVVIVERRRTRLLPCEKEQDQILGLVFTILKHATSERRTCLISSMISLETNSRHRFV